MRELLNWKSWREVPTRERVDRSQSATFLDQLRKLISCVFDLTEQFFRVVTGVSYDDRRCVLLWAKVVMSVSKIADDLVVVKTSRDSRSRLWPRKQRYVKADSIGTIDDGSLRRELQKTLFAVGAMAGISLQRRTPAAGTSAQTVAGSGVDRENFPGQKPVRKSSVLPALFAEDLNRASDGAKSVVFAPTVGELGA